MVFSEWIKSGGLPYRLVKRLFQVIVTLFGLLILTFVIGRVMPIDPVLAIVGQDADQSTYQQMYQQLGLDKPLYVQFLSTSLRCCTAIWATRCSPGDR